ncbi:uncharacterized protein LOC113209839 [Frankliniella occidentalis]|uniref:Uncharacterized protein LOC113209839 n=1 Tax=Frankliniella occidentalis TaxID=133901 RepID=A0A6J1SR99_FRAOC|nr:uncharacterized protein LOC113209839 [Frankliniella occidentalis]XP_052125270.1 uncharacterized protein LOC113209839 [Frankliniella occidentalis]
MEFSELLFDADSDDYLVDDSPSDLVREALEGGVVDDGYEDEDAPEPIGAVRVRKWQLTVPVVLASVCILAAFLAFAVTCVLRVLVPRRPRRARRWRGFQNLDRLRSL